MKLLLAVQGKHREEVERTILIVCEKSPDAAAERAKPVLAVLAKVDSSELPKYLPLLGRLGGPQVLGMIDSSLASENPEIKASAIRALCNWPNAEVADRLWTIAGGDNQEFRQRALYAYVRVVTLESDRRRRNAGHVPEGHETGREHGKSAVGLQPGVDGPHPEAVSGLPSTWTTRISTRWPARRLWSLPTIASCVTRTWTASDRCWKR